MSEPTDIDNDDEAFAEATLTQAIENQIESGEPAAAKATFNKLTLVGYEREAECRNWLRQHGRTAQEWLAVDDRSWNFRPFNPHVFLVDGDVGLDADAAANLAARINDATA